MDRLRGAEATGGGGRRRARVTAAAALCMGAALFAPRCAPRVLRPDPKPEPPPIESTVEPMPPPSPAPPPPSELDLTLDAARRAESGGDRSAALLLYQQAASLAPAGEDRAAIRLALAFLYADPTSPARDLDRARLELDGAVEHLPEGPRAVEGRLLALLLEEILALRAQVTDLKAQSDAARNEAAALQAKLAEKEKELAEIKKILLRDKGKP